MSTNNWGVTEMIMIVLIIFVYAFIAVQIVYP